MTFDILKVGIGLFIIVGVLTQKEPEPEQFCGCRYWEDFNPHPTVHHGLCVQAGEYLQVGNAPNHTYHKVKKWSPIFCENEND